MTPPGDIVFRQALASLHAGQLNDAERSFKEMLRQQPGHIASLNLLSVVLTHLGKYAEAEHYVQSALKLNASSDTTYYNYGIILKALKRPNEALQRFSEALSINETVAQTWNNRGTVLNDLKRYDDAVADFDKAIALQPNYPEAFYNKGQSLTGLKRRRDAIAAYDRALTLKPDLIGALIGRGNVCVELKHYEDADIAFGKALSFEPDLAEAWLGRGNVFYHLKSYGEAMQAYNRALGLKPDLAEAWFGCGNVFNALRRIDEAFHAYDKALSLEPNFKNVEGLRLFTKMILCDWTDFNAECMHLSSSISAGSSAALPFLYLTISNSPADQLNCARAWVASHDRPPEKQVRQGGQPSHDRIRVAYISTDFRPHATAFLMAGVFECHDKSRFEVTGISIGPEDNSEIRQRLSSSFERFIDAEAYSDEQIEALIRELEIDILVDLNGFAGSARTNILARRPAPVQVNYLGYPGTMGADFIDYLISDSTLIPSSHEKYYAEKIAYLPNSYQANDAKRVIADTIFTRAELSLPPTGFVFCCFNNNFKILPAIFDCWMRILGQVEGSVLWLIQDNETAAGNLRKEAAARGIDTERLIFAKRIVLPEHLARHRLADLFLDTLPYNAHTTASDALWTGLPVLTRAGETFAGRVAASLLNAIGLPELITTTLKAYEELAIDLAKHPEKLAAIKNKLVKNRLTTPLFDSKPFTKHIEAAYTAMYERYQAGLPPDRIIIPK